MALSTELSVQSPRVRSTGTGTGSASRRDASSLRSSVQICFDQPASRFAR
jgi:hypothetical protein